MEFLKHTEWPMWFGYAAVASSIITCAMKTMIPLRVVSMTCNALFIVYGFFSGIYPTLILNLILLPLNTVRLAFAALSHRSGCFAVLLQDFIGHRGNSSADLLQILIFASEVVHGYALCYFRRVLRGFVLVST